MADPPPRTPSAPGKTNTPALTGQTPSTTQTAFPRPSSDRLVVGVLVAHGRAPFGFLPTGAPSYYAKIQTERGERVLWSRRLEQAFKESKTQPGVGDPVGIRENGIDPVRVTVRQRNREGLVTSQSTVETPRGHWVVERREYFDERAEAARVLRDPRASRREAVRDHPDLLGAYWVLDSAGKVAQEQIKNPANRERFVALVRETLARTAERGEPMPSVSRSALQKSRAPERGVTQGPPQPERTR